MSSSLIGLLKGSAFFNSALLPDIKNGEVFSAIRNESIDFYHKGGKLFGFDKSGFYTHKKYAGLFDTASRKYKNYVSADEIMKYHGITDMREIYQRVKEYCSLYSGVEASGVSNIYESYSNINSKEGIVVLDIEIAFEELAKESKILTENDESAIQEGLEQRDSLNAGEGINRRKRTDRIDMLLIDKTGVKGKLRFVEAKHYTNSEIRSDSPTPEIINQLKKYDKQIKANRKIIIDQYKNYNLIMKDLFNVSLPNDLDIIDETKLIVFGFDKEQLDYGEPIGKLKKILNDEVYARGSVKKMKPGEMNKLFYK
jgi:hypothetical protein